MFQKHQSARLNQMHRTDQWDPSIHTDRTAIRWVHMPSTIKTRFCFVWSNVRRSFVYVQMEEAVCLAVTEYFEAVKYTGLPYSITALQETVESAYEKPAGATWNTWNEYLQIIQDGICIGAELMLKDYTHYDYEDVIGIVFDVTKSVFKYAENQMGRQIREEHKLANNAAVKIQTKWREANLNPDYAACRHRLIREFKNLEHMMCK